ncbi:AAA-like domain-containing protein [Nostoc sp. FACHB-110]|uniref:AAA-like domain-containing protein n=1 Tax=Nostoc sp. FACHB-110 TaxID=2692834 RepID=UPI00168734AE|nr:AAA-like domain-containing protein [Nostoc sp. FACHB-110]MBD2438934.1 AAA-like domain-containing protein [Nostoc sp. FACHB-110]
MKQLHTTRRRGIVLTPTGLKQLQSAIESLEIIENNGNKFTMAELSDRINVSIKTLTRLWSLNSAVDQKTLKCCFNAFNLKLRNEDYTFFNEYHNTPNLPAPSLRMNVAKNPNESLLANSYRTHPLEQPEHSWLYSDGPVPTDSAIYIERPPIEKLVYREITQPGAVIQIRSPRQMGKSSLVLRLLSFAQMQGYRTVTLNCYQMDNNCLKDLNKLLRYLCWRVAKELNIDPDLNNQWDEEIGCKLSSSFYFHNHLLNKNQRPVVLVWNGIERFFEYPHVAHEFFDLLRSWSEEARQNTNWQKLRLVMVYSTEEYISLDINRFPLNIGLPISLPEFTQSQVENLAKRHGLNWYGKKEIQELMSLVGGHPALIRLSLYYLCCQGMSFTKLVEEAIANGGIYRYHLYQKWVKLQENPHLARTYAAVLATDEQKGWLDPVQTDKLERLGLIRYESDRILPRYEIYRSYFSKQL